MSSDSDSSQDGFATKTTDKGARWEDRFVAFGVVVVYRVASGLDMIWVEYLCVISA